jgi:hypothetical protein
VRGVLRCTMVSYDELQHGEGDSFFATDRSHRSTRRLPCVPTTPSLPFFALICALLTATIRPPTERTPLVTSMQQHGSPCLPPLVGQDIPDFSPFCYFLCS